MSRLALVSGRSHRPAIGRFAEVRLSADELYQAADVGIQRHVSAIRRGLPDKHGHEGGGWGLHIEGAAGELAASKVLGLPWPATVDTFKADSDLPNGVQVRTRAEHGWDLIVRADDRDEDRFVLVTGRAPIYRVHGWIWGRDAKRPGWRKAYGGREPAWFVPAKALNHIQEFTRCRIPTS